jgi:hypothetical protein
MKQISWDCGVDPKARFSGPNFYPQLLIGNGKSDVGSSADHWFALLSTKFNELQELQAR